MQLALPKSFTALRDYDRHRFLSDLTAGVTVGLVALPLAMAFGIASGVLPQAGIYTAIIAGFLISALGGSTRQIGGPTGAFVVIVFGIVAKYGFDALLLCTMMAGVLLLLLGLSGLGSAVKFIPRPVVVGFTNGIAILIASTQIKDFFGLHVDKVPGDFAGRISAFAHNMGSVTPIATMMSVSALALILLMRKYTPRVPGYIVAMTLATAAVALFHLPVETIGTKFGGIPSGFPQFHIPKFNLLEARGLISPAITVALLGAIESLMSAVVADRMSGDQHDPNVELVGQGIANLCSPLFGGIPATGAIARTATNIRAGAKTPMAGMIHAATLLAIVVFAAPFARFVPLAVLAAILMVVSYNMGEWGEIPELLKLSKVEVGVWFSTVLLTVFADLTVAVESGMILGALMYIRNVTTTTTVEKVTREYIDAGWVHILQGKRIPEYVAIFRIHGPFLFGTTEKLQAVTRELDSLPPVIILRLRNMNAIDSTGLHALERLADEVHASGRSLLLCAPRSQPAKIMDRADFHEHIGNQNLCANLDEALQTAQRLYASQQLTAALV
jgi:sulfate permease, SulP family